MDVEAFEGPRLALLASICLVNGSTLSQRRLEAQRRRTLYGVVELQY